MKDTFIFGVVLGLGFFGAGFVIDLLQIIVFLLIAKG